MWPSPRRPWPPPRSVRKCRGFGSPWLGAGERGRPCLPGSGRTRQDNRSGPRHGFGCPQPPGRRLEIVVDGLPLWGGSQLAVHTTMVCPLTRDGVAQRGTATTNGKSPARARRRKELTYPELTGEHGRARVLGVEVGGRWSAEASVFLRCSKSTWSASLARGPSACRLAPPVAGVARLRSCSDVWLLSPGWTRSFRSRWSDSICEHRAR